MSIRRFAASALLLAVAVPTGASAHDDPRNDGWNDSPTRCDGYYRAGHAPERYSNGQPIPENRRRSDHHVDEFDTGQVGPVYVHNHTGHYVVRHEDFYVEVVGGNGYNRDGNQGGWAQGEVDRDEVPADVDFQASAFAGTVGSMHSETACLSVADTRIGDPGTRPTLRLPDGHRGHVHVVGLDGTPHTLATHPEVTRATTRIAPTPSDVTRLATARHADPSTPRSSLAIFGTALAALCAGLVLGGRRVLRGRLQG